MTQQEHILIVGLFAKQLQTIKTLVTLLESRGVLEGDDLNAFHAWTASDAKISDDLIDHAEKIYRAIAEPLGIPLPAKLV